MKSGEFKIENGEFKENVNLIWRKSFCGIHRRTGLHSGRKASRRISATGGTVLRGSSLGANHRKSRLSGLAVSCPPVGRAMTAASTSCRRSPLSG